MEELWRLKEMGRGVRVSWESKYGESPPTCGLSLGLITDKHLKFRKENGVNGRKDDHLFKKERTSNS